MFLLVHGAWHGAWCWSRLKDHLTERDALSTAVDLPGRGAQPAPPDALTLDAYADRVVDLIAHIDEPVTLVGHSLGGATISTVAERVPERLACLVYLCALLQPSGATPADLHANDPDSGLLQAVELADDGLTTSIRADAAGELFFGDCSDDDTAWAVGRLCPEPIGPAMSSIVTTSERWGSVPRAYIRCNEDRAIRPAEQDRMVAEVGADVVVELASSHSPFLSQPSQLADALIGLRDGLA